jgi:hypothetical protein
MTEKSFVLMVAVKQVLSMLKFVRWLKFVTSRRHIQISWLPRVQLLDLSGRAEILVLARAAIMAVAATTLQTQVAVLGLTGAV